MKRDQIKRRPMADSVLHNLEPEAKDYRELDSPGVYFQVKKSGSKSWLLRYKRPDGRWAWLGLGRFPEVSGKAAREEAKRLQQIASDGTDLRVYKDGVQEDKPIFRDSAEAWYQRKVSEGKSAGTLSQQRRYLDNDVLPRIGDKPLDEVTRADCAAIQKGLEDRKALEIAVKVRGWVRQIFSYAIARGLCENNPASELKHIAAPKPKKKNYPYLLENELPEFLRALRQSRSRTITVILVRTVLLTASRPGMVRWAEWSEIDFEEALLTLSGDKMKMGRDHLVPLSRQTLEDLRVLHKLTGTGRYLFPGNGDNPVLSENTLNQALGRIGYAGRLTGHGSRHTASTLLRSHRWDKDFVEAQLAHVEPGMAGVYNKAQYLEDRRRMVQWYADHLDQLEAKTTT